MIDCVNNGVEGSCFSSIGGWGGVDLVFFLNDLSHFFVACSHFRINKLTVTVNGQQQWSTVVVRVVLISLDCGFFVRRCFGSCVRF